MLYVLFLWGIIELIVIVLVAGAIGAMATLGLLLLGMVAGSMILKKERERFALRMQRGGQMATGSADMKDGLFRVMGGTLLFMPGFISDVFAIICMIPALRGMFGGLLMKVFRPDVVVQRFGYRQQGGHNVYEGEVAANDAANDSDSASQSQKESKVIKGEFIEHDEQPRRHD